MRRQILMLCVAVALYGCIGGERVKLDADSPPPPKHASLKPVALSVSDERDEVRRLEKEAWYLGEAPEGDKDLSNHMLIPLAHQIRNDLVDELESIGYEDAIRDDVRKLKVAVREWHFDADTRRLRYRVELAVLEHDEGAPLATSVVQGDKPIAGGDEKSTKQEVKSAYGAIVRSLVRENPAIRSALPR